MSAEAAVPKSCISIQSHVVHGYVGNKCAVFPLQLHGFDVSPINSVQFSNHTGYSKFTGDVLDGEALSRLAEGLDQNGLLRVSHMLTGYMRNAGFLRAAMDLLHRARMANPGLTYVCDPVLGDDGRLYVPEELVGVYRELVVPQADLVTPNQFECETLTGIAIASVRDAARACDWFHERGVRSVVITSMDVGAAGTITALCSHDPDARRDRGGGGGGGGGEFGDAAAAGAAEQRSRRRRKVVEVPKLDARFTGTGDLAAALLLAWTHELGDDLEGACTRTLSTLQVVCRRTLERGRRELDLIGSRDAIERPPDLLRPRSLTEEEDHIAASTGATEGAGGGAQRRP